MKMNNLIILSLISLSLVSCAQWNYDKGGDDWDFDACNNKKDQIQSPTNIIYDTSLTDDTLT